MDDPTKKVMEELEKEEKENEQSIQFMADLLRVSGRLAREITAKDRATKPTQTEIEFILAFAKFTLTL